MCNWIILLVIAAVPSVLTTIFYYKIVSKILRFNSLYAIINERIFEKKLDTLMEVLKDYFTLKNKVRNFVFSSDDAWIPEIVKEINEFTQLCEYKRPFLNEKIYDTAKRLREELQAGFEEVYKFTKTKKEDWTGDQLERYKNVIVNVKNNTLFDEIERELLGEIQKELKLEMWSKK